MEELSPIGTSDEQTAGIFFDSRMELCSLSVKQVYRPIFEEVASIDTATSHQHGWASSATFCLS